MNPTELDRTWTQWLYREHEQINLYYRLKLSTPVIAVLPLATRLGQWDPLRRTITINRATIEKYPWNEVLHILKHEMAHQLVSETSHTTSAPHGRAFVAACERMGLPEWAIRASGDLPNEIPDWRESTLSEEEQRLITRAQKLLALAASDNEHEAALAIQRVREMYAKYNLEQVRENKEARFVSWFLTTRSRRLDVWKSVALSLLNRHYFVRVIHIKQFDAVDCVEYAAAEIMGKKENVLMAEYVYEFLMKTLDSLWEDRRGTHSRREKRSYLLGVLAGFERQLENAPKEAPLPDLSPTQNAALALRVDEELDEAFEAKYPRTRSRGRRQADTGAAYEQGRRDGEKIRLHRPLSHESGNLRGKLPAPR